MKRLMMLSMILAMSAALLGSAGKGDKAKCLENCKADCQKTYTKCIKDAKSEAQKAACKTNLDGCNSNCVNKKCSN